MAAKLYELGDDAGQGAAFKMINQLLAGVHIAAAWEAIIRRQAGSRYPKGLRGDHGVRRKFLDVRKPDAARARRRLRPAQRDGIFVKDLGIIQDMARSAEIPGTGRGRCVADVSDDGRTGMGRDDDASVARMYAQVTGTHCPANRNSSKSLRGGPLMPRFAANLTMMFTDVPFLDRFEAAAEQDFRRRVPVSL